MPAVADVVTYNAGMSALRLEDVARRHGIRLIVRFGSTVTGRTHQASDVDLGVLLERAPETFADAADLETDLQAVFCGQPLDVAVLNHADPLFLKQVADQAELVYGSSRALHAFQLQAFKRYVDYRPYLALEQEYVERKSRELAR